MRLRDVPYWLADRDCAQYLDLLDNQVVLGVTPTREDTAPFDDAITFMMVPLYMHIGPCAFPPVIMLGDKWLTGAHRLRAGYFAGIARVPAYLVV